MSDIQNQDVQVSQDVPATVQIPTAEILAAMTKEDLLKLKEDVSMLAQKVGQDIEAALVAKEKEVVDEVQEVEEEVKTWAEQFRETHGVSVPVAIIVGCYIVWQVVAAVGHALGAI